MSHNNELELSALRVENVQLLARVAELGGSLNGKNSTIAEIRAQLERAQAYGVESDDNHRHIQAEWKRRYEALQEATDGGAWAWVGDGSDDLGSMSDDMVVAISAGHLRAMELRVLKLEAQTDGWAVEEYVSAGVETYAVVRGGKRWAELADRADADSFAMHKAQADRATEPRADAGSRTYTVTANPEVLGRFERLLAMLHWNSCHGHSGTFGMPLDGDGRDGFAVHPEPGHRAEVSEASSYNYDVELAYNDSFGGKRWR